MAESVELATVLFTDLVGSTRLATSVGPVRADQLREEHFGLLRDALASSKGKEVKNTGDGLMVAFASASEAVRCAIAMQQRFERRYRQSEQGLHIRIGVGAGEATVKDGDYFGAPSIEAARLCAHAPSDGILVSVAVKMLAGRCEGVEFDSAGELELKGFPDPVEAFSVAWAPLAEEAGGSSRWPLPAVLRSVPAVAYVGRAEERAALAEALNLARSGQRQVVLLSGEPGIGKTRLASFAAHRAHSESCAVAWGACSEELAVPYEPWIQVCAHLVDHAPQELLERHVGRHKGELARLARNLEGRISDLPAPQSSDPETERYLLFSAAKGLLGEAAETMQLCVVLDDLHWADAESLALLKHVLWSTEQRSPLVIATFRDSELGKNHPLTGVLADLRRLDGVQRIALHGLSAEEVTEIMTAVAGRELEADGIELAAQIAAETDGNPFFVGEILRGLSESGALALEEPTARVSIERSSRIVMPESVREVIERRVERLGEETLDALRFACVIGRTFDLELLSAVAEIDEARLLDQLEAAVAASLLTESAEQVGVFRFAHALINQTLYDALGSTRRARLHERVAQALERLCGADPGDRLAALALHWRLAAVSVQQAKATDYAVRAGWRALAQLAPAEALKLFSDAVELSGAEGSRERCEALIGLGEAQRQTGNGAYRETLLEASGIASALGDAELAARAALANNRGYSSVIGEVDAERLAAIDRALELDHPPDATRRARLFALQAQELSWDADFARRRALADEAISLAHAAGDTRTLVEVLCQVSYALWSADTLEQRTAIAGELVERAPGVRDPALQFSAHYVELSTRIEGAELAHAEAVLERMRASAEQLGQPTFKWFWTFPAASYELMLGDLVAAERLAERGFQLGQEAGEPDAVLIYGAQLGYIRTCQGRGDEMVGLLEQSVDAYPAIAAWRAALAWTCCWLGRREQAAAIVEAAASDAFEHVHAGAARLTALALYADAAAQTGAREAASMLYELIEPWAEHIVWNSVTGMGHARMWLGLLAGALGEHEQADRHLDFACEFQESNGLLLWAARAHLAHAEGLAARGEAARALEHASRALELSREHGYGLFEPRAAALIETHSAAGA